VPRGDAVVFSIGATERIANKAVSPALQFAVEFVEHEVT
jgi:hypothetical protein